MTFKTGDLVTLNYSTPIEPPYIARVLRANWEKEVTVVCVRTWLISTHREDDLTITEEAPPTAERDRAKREADALAQAVAVFGKEHQLRMLQEECGEVVVAVNHHLRNRVPAEEVLAEIADVVILGRQAEVIFGQALQPFIDEKIERLAKHTETHRAKNSRSTQTR